jgi:hypothetical protein
MRTGEEGCKVAAASGRQVGGMTQDQDAIPGIRAARYRLSLDLVRKAS